MTRRERLERKLELRQEWAAKREAKSTAAFKTAHALTEHIPFGQPILVGHHSEGRHRRTIERSHNAMSAAVEHSSMAEHHESKASGIEAQLENSVFSDDENAIEALEARIAEREAKRDRMKEINRLWKKNDAVGLAAIGVDLEKLKIKLAEAGAYWGSKPHLPYEMSNLGATIRTDKKRIEIVKHRQQRAKAAEDAGGTIVTMHGEYAAVTFSEKPDRAILTALKAAGFYWGSGNWTGRAEALPECVKEMITEKTE